MQKWEYATVPLLVHATKQILDNWGDDGWELVALVPGPNQEPMPRGAPANPRCAHFPPGCTLPTCAPVGLYGRWWARPAGKLRQSNDPAGPACRHGTQRRH